MIHINDLENFEEENELRKEIEKRIEAHNDGTIVDFEGLTPVQMQTLHYDFPNIEDPIKIHRLSENQLKECPLLMQVRYLINKMQEEETIKLTSTGAITTDLVKEIYGLGLLKSELIELGYKLYKESNAPSVSITRILLQLSSLAKKRKNTLSLTKKGKELANDSNAILKEILSVLFHKFNWGYFDGFKSENIGKINPAYSMYLLKKYGGEKRDAQFYADRYFMAFPHLITDDLNPYKCYTVRTFERYFRYLGFVEVDENDFLDPLSVKKTSFFDALFSIE